MLIPRHTLTHTHTDRRTKRVKFVQAKSKQAMKQVLGIRDENARMKVTPPLTVNPLAQVHSQEDDMRCVDGTRSALRTTELFSELLYIFNHHLLRFAGLRAPVKSYEV